MIGLNGIERSASWYYATGGSGYKYSESINKVGAAKALTQISFNEAVFIARYLPIEPVVFINEGGEL